MQQNCLNRFRDFLIPAQFERLGNSSYALRTEDAVLRKQ